jgi:hypothetical protein
VDLPTATLARDDDEPCRRPGSNLMRQRKPLLLRLWFWIGVAETWLGARRYLAIAARSEARFIDIKPEPRTKLRRTNNWLFIEIPRERGGGKVHYTEEQLTAMRGGLTVEQWRRKIVRKWGKR